MIELMFYSLEVAMIEVMFCSLEVAMIEVMFCSLEVASKPDLCKLKLECFKYQPIWYQYNNYTMLKGSLVLKHYSLLVIPYVKSFNGLFLTCPKSKTANTLR